MAKKRSRKNKAHEKTKTEKVKEEVGNKRRKERKKTTKEEKTQRKVEKVSKRKSFWYIVGALAILAVFGGIVAFKTGIINNPEVPLITKGNYHIGEAEPEIKVFIVSYCPYGRQFALRTLPEIAQKYKNWDVYFITAKDQEGNFLSMHGDTEAQENLREACIRDIYGKDKLLDYLKCFYPGNKQPSDCMKELGIDEQAINTCMQQNKALEEDYEETIKYNIRGSPTTVITYKNKTISVVGLRSAEAIFNAIKGLEKGFEKIPAVFLTTKNCKPGLCPTEEELKSFFERNFYIDLQVETKYYEENKELFDTLNLTMLPAMYFKAEEVENKEFFKGIARYFRKVGDLYVTEFGPYLLKGQDKNGTIDVYIMSHCPYGNAAIKLLDEIKKNMPGIKINVHYIVSKNATGSFISMHGPEEVFEDLRQVCIRELYPAEYWDYMQCIVGNYTNSATYWKHCAEEANISISAVESCSTGKEAKEYLQKDYERTEEYHIGSSPTYVINGRWVISGLMQPDQLQRILCSFGNYEGCNVTISENGNAVPQGGSC